MQSIFRLPWCSDQLGGKMSDKAALEKMRATPMLEIPMLSKLKRKYSDAPDAASLSMATHHPPKKVRTDMDTAHHTFGVSVPSATSTGVMSQAPAAVQTVFPVLSSPQHGFTMDSVSPMDVLSGSQQAHSISHPAHALDRTAKETSELLLDMPDVTSGLTPLQQVIENEFNMQILFKHNELRLIEQELAKCQIALEQLRRCELRPYPGMDAPSAAVSAGVGPAVISPPGLSQPSHPAPHGVTDGPYSRHYRRWLLHDPQFDSMTSQAVAQAEHALSASGRPMRNNGTVRKASTKSLGSGTRSCDPLHSIPNYPSAPTKDKSAPLVLRRSTDGLLVKLICNNCHRGNFSSIQGFLNHCRIAHKVDYKSHDLAAIDCGKPLDENEMANLPAETHASTPKPAVTRSATTTAHSSNAKNLVHPLNTAVSAASPLSTPVSATPSVATPAPSLSSPAPSSFGSMPFKASSQVPRLSAFFAKHHLGGDLEQAAFRAKQKTDIYPDEDLLSPQTPDVTSPTISMAGMRTVAGATQPSAAHLASESTRPPSRKGYRQPAVQRPRPSPLAPSEAFSQRDLLQSPQDSPSAVSPASHAADSNPGLVSDHEDDDHGSASEEEAPHSDMPHSSLPTVARTCGDHMEIDVTDDEELGQHGVIIRRNSMLSSDARGLRTDGSPSRKMGMGKGGK